MKRVHGVLLLSASLLLAGCYWRPGGIPQSTGQAEGEGPPNQEGAPSVRGGPLLSGSSPAQSDVRRGAEMQAHRNMLRQIAQLYLMFDLERNRPPATVQEFMSYIQRDYAEGYQALEQQVIILVPKVRPSSNAIIAYERDPYQKWNNRLVAFGDGRVETMNEPEFQAALRGGQ